MNIRPKEALLNVDQAKVEQGNERGCPPRCGRKPIVVERAEHVAAAFFQTSQGGSEMQLQLMFDASDDATTGKQTILENIMRDKKRINGELTTWLIKLNLQSR